MDAGGLPQESTHKLQQRRERGEENLMGGGGSVSLSVSFSLSHTHTDTHTYVCIHIHTYGGTLLSHKEERNFAIFKDTDGPGGYHA